MLHRNLGLKAAALALAIFLWFWVLLKEKNPIVEETVSTPITAEGVEADLALQSPLPEAEVRVRGLQQEMTDARHHLAAFVSCQGLEAGSHRLSVKVRPLENVSVVDVRPPVVPAVLEEVVLESRQVELQLVGKLPGGYQLLGAEASPRVVQLSGPRSLVDRATRALVTMELGRAMPEMAVLLPVQVLDSAGEGVPRVDVTPARVEVAVAMKLAVSSHTVPVVVRTRGSLPDEMRIASVKVEPAMVTVVGAASQLQAVEQIETEELDLSRATGSFAQRLLLVVPTGVRLLADPSVKVTVKVKQAQPVGPAAEETAED